MTSRLLALLAQGASNLDAKVILESDHDPGWTYGELDAWASRFASVLLRSGVEVGDRVAYQVDKSPMVVALHLALLRLGAIQLPLNPAYTPAEVGVLLADAEPLVVVHRPDHPAVGPWANLTLDAQGGGSLVAEARDATPLSRFPRVADDDGAALLYTSGTTGRPKGALLTHRNLACNVENLVAEWGFSSSDVLLHVLPLFHTHGLFVATHCALVSGAAMVFLPWFDAAEAVGGLSRCSVMMGVPTHYTRLLAESTFDAAATRNVRVFISGSAPMPLSVHQQMTERTGQVVLERYGMTETSMLTSNLLRGERRVGSVGRALPSVALRVCNDDDEAVPIGEIGHVQVRGANVFDGYWRRPDLASQVFTADGWFRTGDLGRLDDDYLYLVGRAKDLVITGGLNVHPSEVEAVLEEVSGVSEAAVIGVPDDDFGEAVVAVLVPQSGTTVNEDELRQTLRTRLAGYKVPRRFIVVDELPRNAMGKVQKAVLRARYADT